MARGTKTYTTGKIRSTRLNKIIYFYSNTDPAGTFQSGTDYEFEQEYYEPVPNSLDCADESVTPDPFTFVDVTEADLSTLYTSNTITISGMGALDTVPVTISAGGEYSKNGGAYTSAATTAQNTDTFTVRATSSSSTATAVNITLSAGPTSDTYSILTRSDCYTYTVYNTGITVLNFTYRECNGGVISDTVPVGENKVVCGEYNDTIVIDSGDGYFIQGSTCTSL